MSAPLTAPTDLPPSLPVTLAPGAQAPSRAHADDAGLDLRASVDVVIAPGGRALVPTGIRMALPAGTVGLVCPRSGLAVRHGITVLNGPGIVDAGYRGEVQVPLHNTDLQEPFTIRAGDRIAQLVITPCLTPEVRTVADLPASDRADAGFGSSGGFGAGDEAAHETTTRKE